MSWAQSKPWRNWLFKDSQAPGVLKSKWLERRHIVRPTNRWIKDRTGELQVSWMNGTGTVIWENRFGCWNGWSEQARSILRSMIPIQRRYVSLFAGEEWTPLVDHREEKVFASLWEDEGLKLWTLVNRADEPYSGNLLAVQQNQGVQYYDLIKGKQVSMKVEDGNTWEWTESEQTDDGRTRYCLIRGGSFFKTAGSDWYVDGGAQPSNRATKMLLVWPGLDRCSTVGFRCVVDMKE